ncbi:hypothetical protein PV08_03058 [Exophiala spinifera]|uniref:Uncharacterized protein n=1 Tax=Exophiala spinifera TaxID=91928 RepID=A0A0D2C597_9EURO|nr:uncharacterized protein PV08_03058 [Exophiala spinifera]KIW18769.1 hypothetical protein PV08_03058 [Exophiala spinifera]
MTSSRYSRLNPRIANTGLAGQLPPEEPIQFSNTINPRPSEPLPSQSSNGSLSSILNKAAKGTVTDSQAYAGSEGNLSRPPAQRQRTRSSLFRAASSVWSYSRKAVSHFSVPKVAAPWEHEFSEKSGTAPPPSDTVRYFDPRRQRRRLFVNSSFQWLMTAIICAGLAAILYGFTTFNTGVTSTTKHVFNALVTGLSICLGLSLASSLKCFAQMMRWRFLASSYRSLQDFELVMNCDSQTQTLRLLWAGRTPNQWYPNKTQVMAFLYITVNLALQVFTALLGLTYSIDISSELVRLTYGNVSIVDLSYIGNAATQDLFGDDLSSSTAQFAQFSTSNTWGITGQDYPVFFDSFDEDGTGFTQAVYRNEEFTAYWYRFVDQSPLANSLNTVTDRTVNCTAECQEHKVVAGGYAGFDSDDIDTMWDVTWVDDDGYNNTWTINDVATGATTWLANMTSCGDRCTQVYALQSADNNTDDVPVPRFFSCKSYVSQVSNVDEYVDPAKYELPDVQSQYLAGAIGWSGVQIENTDGSLASDLQMVVYPADSIWSPPGNYTELGMADLVMRFTAGAIAAMDSGAPRLNVTGYGPAPAQFLNVKWKYAGAILGGIPVAQFVILCAVVGFANKAVIKDTSHLSTARLLRPVVDRLGDAGCLLTGDEIAEKLGNYRLIYGVRNSGGAMPPSGAADDGEILHIDVVDESEGLGYRRGPMPPGRYNGLSSPEERVPLLQRRDNTERATEVRARRSTLGARARRMSL